MNGSDTIFWEKLNHSNWVEQKLQDVNRAFLFGDGLFETMVFQNGKIRFSDLHLHRLITGCEILGMNTEKLSTIEEIEKVLELGLGKDKLLRVRWTVYRSGKGKYTPLTDNLEESLQLEDFHIAPLTKKSAFVHPEISLSFSPWSSCKTLNALPYVIANRDRVKLGMEEVILLNPGSFVSEAGAANLFWVKSGVFYTPSLGTGCIEGVGRSVIIAFLNSKGVEVQEGFFRLDDIYEASSVFTSNVTGISYLLTLEGKTLGQERFEMIEQLFELDKWE
jgi:branched-subunit amino acid aminotransferase/4-amino-4-deoxychorismate lyase